MLEARGFSPKFGTVKKIGNILIASPHFIIKSPTEITSNFTTGFNTETTLASGADLCGGGAISNAGTLSVVSGGAIGASSPMGNVINSGTINVGGDVRVKSFTVPNLGEKPRASSTSFQLNTQCDNIIGCNITENPATLSMIAHTT